MKKVESKKHEIAEKMSKRTGFGTPEHMKKYKEFEAKQAIEDKKYPLARKHRQEELNRAANMHLDTHE